MKPTQKNGAFTLGAVLTLLLVIFSFYEVPTHANVVSNTGKPAVSHPVAAQPALGGPGPSAEVIKRGEYLAKVADCVSCHTDLANSGKPFAGGREMKTPFGSLYTPNLTPDKETGIGEWSDEDFVRAVREGIRPDGSYYYPVFPYNYFNAISREEVLAIKAYLSSIPPVKKQNQEQQMSWPWSMRFLQFGWRLLYFDFQEHGFKKDPQQSETWNRGAFIVKGPGHCVMCHTELNLFGVPKEEYLLAGAFVDGYFAPDISSQGLKHLKREEVAAIFEQDKMPTGAKLGGPMAEVEHNSLRYLTHNDTLAIAEFLKTVKSQTPPIEDIGGDPMDETAGKNLYESNCSICHAYGAGAPKVSDQPAWEHLLDQGKDRLYEVAIKGDGPMPAKGNCKQCSDERIKAAVDYMLKLARNKGAGTQDDEVETVKVLEPAKPLGVPNVVRDPHDVPAPIHRKKPTTVKLELTTTEVVSALADGSTYSFWTFNNTVPGPMLRVMVGDTVELTIKNSSDSVVSHNADLHAVNGPGGGAPMETVAPGESKTFKFKALNVGAFVYHCAFPPPYLHIAQGMYGAIIVEPVGGLPKVDKEFYVMQGEWYTSGKFGQKGHQAFDEAKAHREKPEFFTFNGHATALKTIKPLQAKVGESIRIFFGNGGPNVGSNFHIIGEVFNKVYTGSPETFVLNEEVQYVPPGSVAIFELTLEVPGNYLLVDHALWRVAKGGLGILKVSGPPNPAIYLSGPNKTEKGKATK